MGIYYGTPRWNNGDFWVWGNYYGVIDMRSTNTTNCVLELAVYSHAGVDGLSGWHIYGGSSRTNGNHDTAEITVPAKNIPIFVYNSSGVPKRATNVYVYNSSGKPVLARGITVYDSSGKPKTVTWR